MKIEFLEAGADECPLLRIFGRDPETIQRLGAIFKQLAEGVIDSARIDEIPGMEAVGDCAVLARTHNRDRGLNRQRGAFYWELTRDTWDNVAWLLVPFCGDLKSGFQWLDSVGEIQVLVSIDGLW